MTRPLSMLVCLLLCLFPILPIVAQTPAPKPEPTIDAIMRGPEFVGTEPTRVRWARDGRRVFFEWKEPGSPRDKDPDTFTVNADGSGLRKLTEVEKRDAPPTGGDLSKDKTRTVFTEDGDLFLHDHAKGRTLQLTRTTDVESNARFTFDQRGVWFTRGGNLFVLSLDSGVVTQKTNFKPAGATPTPSPRDKGTDSQEYLKREEAELLDTIKQRARRREEAEAKRLKTLPVKEYQLAAQQTVQSLQLSPDEKFVTAILSEPGRGTKAAVVPNYVTESAYSETIPARNKVGDTQTRTRLAVLTIETGEVKFVDPGFKQPAKPDAKNDKPTDREVGLFQPTWSEDGKNAVLWGRAADNKDQWILRLDAATAKVTQLVNIHDDAWVGGTGSFTLGWMPDNRSVYFLSERTGFMHLSTVGIEGGEPRALTAGNFEVFAPRLNESRTGWYFVSNETHPGERCLYSMALDGGARTRLSSLAGIEQAEPSPDGMRLALVASTMNRPPELFLQDPSGLVVVLYHLSKGESPPDNSPTPIQVTVSPSKEWLAFPWKQVPVETIPARDGAKIYGRIYKPEKFVKGGPAVLFVHGAGYLQNAHKYWSNYYREYMFHHFLMEKGYLVLDIDYRGSAGYGRDWRTGIYRHMGGKDLSDHVDAVNWLVATHGVDPKRVGIYGGSYGGFITLMAMFTTPDTFAAGAALRPVTDWAHYNHPYTSNILNSPQDDPEAYKRSSPIYFAQGLKGALLICHGMVDVNVHFQDSVRLAQRLIELRKENWELAAYPVEDHGFVENTSWADEYKRIFRLFETNLKVPAKAEKPARR